MKRLIPAALALLSLVACSKKGYDQKEVDALFETAAAQQLDEEQTAKMIQQNIYAFNDLRDALLDILAKESKQEVTERLDGLRADHDFVTKAQSAEKMWRYLTLNRTSLTEANADAMERLDEIRRIVDMLNYDVERRTNRVPD